MTHQEMFEYVGNHFVRTNGRLPETIVRNEKCTYKLNKKVTHVNNGMNDFVVSYKYAAFEFQIVIRTNIALVNGKIQIVSQKPVEFGMVDHQESYDRAYEQQERAMLGGY